MSYTPTRLLALLHSYGSVYIQEKSASEIHQGLLSLLPLSCESFYLDCCAQFIVSAQAILSNPIELYQDLLSLVLENDRAAQGMEFLWHVLFTHKCDMILRSQEQYLQSHFTCGGGKRKEAE